MINEDNCRQRLSIKRLEAWQKLGYGMFISFGMSTFEEKEISDGDMPQSTYNPGEIDVEQWIRVARDAGFKYAILTAKHVAGHALWNTSYSDYKILPGQVDVVEAFVTNCRKYGIVPGLYYCSWDNHHLFGSKTPSMTTWNEAYTTEEYQAFQINQITELLTNYGEIGEFWIDIPSVLNRGYRHKLYNLVAKLQPDTVIVMNHGVCDGSVFKIIQAWPTDVITIEKFLPYTSGFPNYREIEGETYYMPGEVCDTICQQWFYLENDELRQDNELLGMYLVARSRNTNFLLNVPPDKTGLIPAKFIDILMRLKRHIDYFKK